jgi:hypothetical protein
MVAFFTLFAGPVLYTCHFGGTGTEIPVLAEPTSHQRQAFDLIGAAIPLALT